MFFIEPPLLVDWQIMHIELIEDVIRCSDAPCEDRCVDFVEGKFRFFDQLCTLLCLFNPARRKGDIRPTCPSFLLVPDAFSMPDNHELVLGC